MIETRDRTKFLGASEIADVLGLGSGSAYEVWARKTGNMPEKESTPEMRRGTKIEPLALEDFMERNGLAPSPTIRTQLFLIDPQHPYLAATLDLWVDEPAAWEFKSTGHYAAKEWDHKKGLFPPRHALQNMYQRACACAFYKIEQIGGGLVHFPMEKLEGEDFPLPYDPELGAMLLDAGAKFWKDHVLTGIPPALSGTSAEAELFKKRYASADPGKVVVATPYIAELVAFAREQKALLKKEEKEFERLKLTIQDFMGDAAVLELPDGNQVTWKNDGKGRCSWKAIAEELGASKELIATHTPDVGARKFLLGTDEED